MSEWVFYVHQTAHAICRRSFGQSQDSFCFSLFVFRFSLFVLRFSLFDNRSASCFYCLVSDYMSEWVCEWTSEWVRKWVSVLRQSNSSCHMQTFISSKSRLFLFFTFRFSLFVFRFSLFDHRSVSCCYCYLRTWIRECLSEWVRKWVSVLRQSNSSCHMQTFTSSKFRFFLFFAFRFSLFVFRFSFFAFR